MGSMEDNTSGGSYAYRASKAALNAVTKSLALDLEDKGITVALLHPGGVIGSQVHEKIMSIAAVAYLYHGNMAPFLTSRVRSM